MAYKDFFDPTDSWRHQTFHGIPLSSTEGREGVNPTHMDGRGVWVKFTHVMINWQFLVSVKAGVTKLSKTLA